MAELRLEVLQEPELSGDPVMEVCRRRKLSRDTFYTYKRRYEQEGIGGLEPRSTRPNRSPNRIDPALEQHICDLRRAHPRWGPKTIRSELIKADIAPPAPSTIGQVLKRNNLIAPAKPRASKATRRFERDKPNELWQIDATQVELSDGTKSWVIDALDDHSRYLVGAIAVEHLTSSVAWGCLEDAFTIAIPTEVLSDNGSCFTGRLFSGRTVEFERKLAEMGIRHIRATPGHPQTLGKLERLQRTLKEWLSEERVPKDIVELQDQLNRFRAHYNDQRCHQGIGDVPPGRRFRAVSGARPVAGHVRVIRKVIPRGKVTLRPWVFYLGSRYVGLLVALEKKGDHVRVLLGDEIIFSTTLIPGIHYYSRGRGGGA